MSTHSLAYLPFLQRGEEEGKGKEIGRGENASVWMEVVRRSEEEGGGRDWKGVYVCIKRIRDGQKGENEGEVYIICCLLGTCIGGDTGERSMYHQRK